MNAPRILHSAQMRNPQVGVIRQMEYEQNAADELGISWKSRMFCSGFDDSPIVVTANGIHNWYAFKKQYYEWLNEQLDDLDLVMLRYAKNDPFQLNFIRKCKLPVVTMHHTLEVYEMIGNAGIKSRLTAEVERLIGRFALARVDGIAAVTKQILDYERSRSGVASTPVIHYSNGAVYGDHPVLPSKVLDAKCHEFMFLSSSFPNWLGLDLLFNAAKKTDRSFKVHVVGGLTKSQEDMLAADSRFACHGFLEKVEIDELMSRCTLGLSTFGIHRKRFTEGNTLKAREYLRAGLPVYAGHIDIFDQSFPYHMDGPADFDKILGYADKMIHVDRFEVSAASRPLIEKKQLVAKMYKKLGGVIEGHKSCSRTD